MAQQYLLIDQSGTALDCILWDGVSDWSPPAGLTAVRYDGGWSAGWTWDGATLNPVETEQAEQ